ncbi:hypothetical protein CAP31_00570 [Sulfuriferula sp. AH1]|nr:hypothetical protein CAP31_00570 [Sulfuriferula sp. AH1]
MPAAKLPELAGWQRYQLDLARHIRDPGQQRGPRGVDRQRLQIYRTLVFDKIETAVSACFPVLSGILGKRKWRRLVREFLAVHRCATPYLRQIPDEFLQFLQREWQTGAAYPDFMLELAHYEWIELALSTSTVDQAMPDYDRDGDLLDGVPLLNPVAANLTCRYPVHRLSRRYQPAAAPAQPTHLLVFRNAADDIRFSLLNAVSARLIELITPGRLSGRAVLQQLTAEISHPAPDALLEFGHDLLLQLRTQGCILGTVAAA